jgi:hypothetical protein
VALKISASDLVTKRQLLLDDTGLEYNEGAILSGRKRFRFAEVDCLLLSSSSVLSFQVAAAVYSIPTKPDDAKHREFIDTLVKALKSTL